MALFARWNNAIRAAGPLTHTRKEADMDGRTILSQINGLELQN